MPSGFENRRCIKAGTMSAALRRQVWNRPPFSIQGNKQTVVRFYWRYQAQEAIVPIQEKRLTFQYFCSIVKLKILK